MKPQRSTLSFTLIALFCLLGLSAQGCRGRVVITNRGGRARARASTTTTVTVIRPAPPAPPRYSRPRCPGPRYVWVSGRYDWRGNRYVWVRGRWAVPPRGRRAWRQGRWQRQGKTYVFIQGSWN